ncbi:MAG: N-acetyltransferase [Acidimicrobiales bacterium]|nr:N-acetyltransferase [Acidimicrobiales bacterium]
MPDATADVRHDSGASRFVIEEGDAESELRYRRRADRLILTHTGVPDALSGRGIGGRLVRAARDHARAEHLTIVPWCPFARRWLADHAGEAEDVSVDWDTLPPQA